MVVVVVVVVVAAAVVVGCCCCRDSLSLLLLGRLPFRSCPPSFFFLINPSTRSNQTASFSLVCRHIVLLALSMLRHTRRLIASPWRSVVSLVASPTSTVPLLPHHHARLLGTTAEELATAICTGQRKALARGITLRRCCCCCHSLQQPRDTNTMLASRIYSSTGQTHRQRARGP